MSLKFNQIMDLKLLFCLPIERKVISFSSQRLKLSKEPIPILSATFQLTELRRKDGLDSLDLLIKKNLKKLCQLIIKAFSSLPVAHLLWLIWQRSSQSPNSMLKLTNSSDSDCLLSSFNLKIALKLKIYKSIPQTFLFDLKFLGFYQIFQILLKGNFIDIASIQFYLICFYQIYLLVNSLLDITQILIYTQVT